MSETRTLARFVVDTRFTDLPGGLVENCKIAVLDALGAGFVGSVQPWSTRILSVVRSLGGAADASVIHQDWRTDVARAALANGVLIGAFECEPLTGSHASGTVLPAALAVSQRERLDGARFLTALALGFEVSARIARTAVGLETARGFHNPGTQGPFGAAAAVGRLYALDEEGLTSALGIAGSSSAGLLEFAWSGGDTKRLHLGRASQLGLESALLARQGVRGPATVLEGRSGYFNAFSTSLRLAPLLEGLGTDWAIEPPYSLPFTTAVALTRDLSNPLVYDESAVHDPLVRDLAQRIELEPREDTDHAAPHVWPAEVIVESGDRRHTLRTQPHKGAPSNPFTWAEVCEKFRRYTTSVLEASRATALIDAIARLETVTDMADVAALVART
jgi:2-methylcitrate dehydratase PrpD